MFFSVIQMMFTGAMACSACTMAELEVQSSTVSAIQNSVEVSSGNFNTLFGIAMVGILIYSYGSENFSLGWKDGVEWGQNIRTTFNHESGEAYLVSEAAARARARASSRCPGGRFFSANKDPNPTPTPSTTIPPKSAKERLEERLRKERIRRGRKPSPPIIPHPRCKRPVLINS